MRKFASIIVIAAAVFAHAGIVAAQDRSSARSACRADYQRLCANVPRGEGRVRACFEANLDKLTPACRGHVEAALRERERQQPQLPARPSAD